MRLVVVSLLAVVLLTSTAHAQTPSVPFEMRWGMSLTDNDKAQILEIARLVSDRPIAKVLAQPMLPASAPYIRVSYQNEIVGTSVIVARLEVRKLDPRHWQSAYLDSLDIRRGEWATKRELFVREVQRRFHIDDAEINLPQDDELSYDELARLLRAIKSKAVVWRATTLPSMDIKLEDIARVSAVRSSRRYAIVVAPSHTTTSYHIDAEFDGKTVIVKRVGMAIP